MSCAVDETSSLQPLLRGRLSDGSSIRKGKLVVKSKFNPPIHYISITESTITHRAEGISRDCRGSSVTGDLRQKLEGTQRLGLLPTGRGRIV